MLAAPLCGSRLRPHPQVGHRIASSRTSSPSSFFSSRSSTQDKSRNEGMMMKYACRDEKLLNYTPQKSSSKLAGSDPSLNVEMDVEILDLMELQRDSDLPSEITLTTGGRRLHYFQHDDAPCCVVCNWLKLAVLSALLALQDSQHAVALAETSIDVHPIDFIGDLGDISTGFTSAFLLIFFSELGDKTFFIAALLSAQNSGTVVFFGTFGALAAMTIISVILGRTFHYVDGILPFSFGGADLPVDDIAAVCLLIYFGISTLIEATSSDGSRSKEEQEEAELAVSELSRNGTGIMASANTVISTFLLVFVAEWGDKSFFSTIALAAASSPLGVIGGALAGHGVATLLAVVGGSLLGTFLSEKVIAYVGGSLFLLFAAVTLIDILG